MFDREPQIDGHPFHLAWILGIDERCQVCGTEDKLIYRLGTLTYICVKHVREQMERDERGLWEIANQRGESAGEKCLREARDFCEKRDRETRPTQKKENP
jgi:hypothetical protein